jgi:myo-inositol-1(or 4)-monophosphatase
MIYSEENLAKLLHQVESIVSKAGAYILDNFRRVADVSVRDKGDNSLVSYIDEMAEQMLMSELLTLIPDAGILAEETGSSLKNDELIWIIDPLDGTTNYLYGLPCFSVSVALVQKGNPILGVVFDPFSDEMFSARKGGRAMLNGVDIQVSDRDTLKRSLIAMGFPVNKHDHIPELLSCLEYFIYNTRGVRRWGSAAMDLAYVACGRYDAFVEYGLSIWDIAAGVLIVESAGGKVSDLVGNDNHLSSGAILAGNPAIYNLALPITKKAFERQ